MVGVGDWLRGRPRKTLSRYFFVFSEKILPINLMDCVSFSHRVWLGEEAVLGWVRWCGRWAPWGQEPVSPQLHAGPHSAGPSEAGGLCDSQLFRDHSVCKCFGFVGFRFCANACFEGIPEERGCERNRGPGVDVPGRRTPGLMGQRLQHERPTL